MPVVPPPESLEDEQQVLLRDPDLPPAVRGLDGARPGLRDPLRARARAVAAMATARRAPVDHIWLRRAGPAPDDPALHQALLAFVSDMSLLDTALLPHGKSIFSQVQVASLDHAMWFHRPFRVDEWLLYVQDSPIASGARGFNRGAIYTRDGAGRVGGAGRADPAALSS